MPRSSTAATLLSATVLAACGGDASGPRTAPPTVETLPATGVTTAGGILNATVNPNGAETTWDLETGETEALGQSCLTTEPATLTGDAARTVQCTVAELSPGATLHYRIVAENSEGRSAGEILTLTTNPTAPTVTTLPAVDVTAESADLRGAVAPNGLTTVFWFEAGFTPGLGQFSLPTTLSQTSGNFSVGLVIGINSPAGTTVYYRVVAENEMGRVFGEVLELTTPGGGA